MQIWCEQTVNIYDCCDSRCCKQSAFILAECWNLGVLLSRHCQKSRKIINHIIYGLAINDALILNQYKFWPFLMHTAHTNISVLWKLEDVAQGFPPFAYVENRTTFAFKTSNQSDICDNGLQIDQALISQSH